jgi:hypothetical protein
MFLLKKIAASVLLAGFVLVPGFAQDSRGAISGRVTDSGAAPIPNAEVKATNAETGVVVASRTNENGIFGIPYLVPGNYQITVEYTGFKKFSQRVEVRVNDQLQVETGLSVGDVSEVVEVKSETPILSTGEASIGQVIDEKRIQELPLFAGNAMDLVHLAPGTVNGTNLRLRKAPFNNAPSQFSSVGGGNYQNEFTIDGVSNTYSDGTQPRVAFSPPQTAISEFKVQSTAYDATQGNTMGSTVNVNTKGGTNQLRGEVHWWLRHSVFDAPTIFQNRQGLGVPVYQDNRYGISGGSPIYLPKVYNGKNRTFWFFAFEGNKFGDPNVGQITGTVPTAKMRQGDLSEYLALGANYQVYDPFSTRPAPTAGQFQRSPIPGNLIPQNRLNPVALKMMSFYPEPNQAGTREFRNNYFFGGKAIEDYWTTIGRVDHAFSDKHRMFLRIHRDYWQEDKNRLFAGDPITGVILNRINKGIALDDVYVLSPNLLMNLRYGITFQEFPEARVSSGFDLATLGFSPQLTNLVDASVATFPRLNVTPFTVLSNWESGDGSTSSIIHNPVAALTWLKGKHSLKFGADIRNIREFRNRFPADTSPDLNFTTAFTNGPLNTSAPPQLGGAVASFLLGVPAGSMTRSASYAEQSTIYGFYLQDDIKWNSKLTINVGLRYELETAIVERYNRSVYNYAYNEANPIEAAAVAAYARSPITEIAPADFRVRGGLTFAGVNGNPARLWNSDRNNWMPRVSFAYSLTPKTVLRAGYGIFYGPIGTLYTNSIQTGFGQSTPIQASLDNGLTFPSTLTNPFPNGLIAPAGAANGLRTNLGQGLSVIGPNRKNPYAQRWSFGLQREFPWRFLLDMSYVGNRGTQLNIQRDINGTPNRYLAQSTTQRDQAAIDYLGQQINNPFLGLDPIYGQRISRANLLRPYPHFGGINVVEPIGYSWYHALQARIEKRYSMGFGWQLSYTWAKAMEAIEFLNPADPVPYESIAGLDRTNRLTSSGYWELPFGRGKMLASNLAKPVNFVVSGWQLNGMMQFQSGAPLGFGNRIFTGDLDQVLAENRSVDRWFNWDPSVTNPASRAGFVAVAGQQLGSNVRAFPLRFGGIRGPIQHRWDASLIKNFKLSERWKVQFRAETYNLANYANLANPNTDPTSTAFGTITGQDPPRSWQFALKVTF